MTAQRLVIALLAAGCLRCDDAGVVVAPIVDLPDPGSEADPLPTLDEVDLSVARAGAATALASATFGPGQALTLDGLQFDDDLVIHLTGRSRNVEIAYGRTCRFDLVPDAAIPPLHLWFTRTVHWADAAIPSGGIRYGATQWATADEGVAIALGVIDGAAATEIEQFDVRANRWTTVASVRTRLGGVAAPLGDGRAVMLGGRDDQGQPIDTIEVVDPLAVAAARVETVIDPRLGVEASAATLSAPGELVVIGGANDAGPVATVWTLRVNQAEGGVLDPPRQLSARLAVARSAHTLTRLSDDIGAPVVVIGGRDAAGEPVAAAELYRPLREGFSATFSHRMVVPRSRHAAIRTPDGSVLVIGGIDAAGNSIRTLESFSIDGGFVSVGELPADAGLVDFALTTLPDGRILVTGGRLSPGGPAVASAYIIRLDPTDGSVDLAATDTLAVARAGHLSTLLCDGTVQVIGGDDVRSGERYQPPSANRR